MVKAEGNKILPWLCLSHPNAQIKHSWDQTQYLMNGYPAGEPFDDGNDTYECSICGKELSPPPPPERP